MPWKRIGNKVYTKASGKWKLKQTAKSIANAKKIIRLLKKLKKEGKIK